MIRRISSRRIRYCPHRGVKLRADTPALFKTTMSKVRRQDIIDVEATWTIDEMHFVVITADRWHRTGHI